MIDEDRRKEAMQAMALIMMVRDFVLPHCMKLYYPTEEEIEAEARRLRESGADEGTVAKFVEKVNGDRNWVLAAWKDTSQF